MMASIYDSIRELDDEVNGGQRLPEMSVESYMIPPPFWELGGSPIKMDHIKNYMITPRMGVNGRQPKEFVKCANKSNRIRVKNIRTGVSFEFTAMINAARFLGATRKNVTFGILDEIARVYRLGSEEYVFEYDGKQRPLENGSRWNKLDRLIEVVSSKRMKWQFASYLAVAKWLGLLVGHILEEEEREREGEPAKGYAIGKERYTLEFGGKIRDKDCGRDIVCHWKGIYDGDWGKISSIKVTYGKPIMRD